MSVIALLDYGSGNLRSAHKALLKIGAEVRICQTPAEMRGAAAVVLPGVGAFDDCMNALQRQELFEASRISRYCLIQRMGECRDKLFL